jgi:gliding motility-associated-like protein
MSIRKYIFIVICSLFITLNQGFGSNFEVIQGDSTACLVELELEQLDNGDFLVSLISDTTWSFPQNVVSTAQITIKATAGQFDISEVNNLINGVVFFKSGIIKNPVEAPQFDYISISLGSQGTANITFQKGVKVNLFSLKNVLSCNNGSIRLMDNNTDPFYPPNQMDANVGQQMTVAGFSLADIPIGIRGNAIACNLADNNSNVSLQIVKQDISCAGALDARIIAKGNGGTAPYSYLWNTGDTVSTLNNLAAGTYSVTLTDGNNDTVSTSITITEPSALNLTFSTFPDSDPNGHNGTAHPTVTGGTAPYNYLWSNGATQASQTSLSKGTYSLTVTDINGCNTSGTVTIDSITCPSIDVTMDINTPLCAGDSTGGIEIRPLTGTAPHTFLWENANTTSILNNIPAGNYIVTITDANGCTAAVSASVSEPNPLLIQLNTNEGTGNNDGQIVATVSGGVGTYTYAWSNGGTNAAINNLADGTYHLTVTDGNACTLTATASINDNNGGGNNGQNCQLQILDSLGMSLQLDTIGCAEEGQYCLPIPLDSISLYSLLLNNSPYQQFAGCRFDTFFAYTYAALPGLGNTGPYTLNQWTINGTTFSGQFPNIENLVDSMNVWDTKGNWDLLSDIRIIQGGSSENTYGQMSITAAAVPGSQITLNVNTNLRPAGTLIKFRAGQHELILTRKSTNCSDTLRINQPCKGDRDSTIVFNILIGEKDSINLATIYGAGATISENQCPNLSGENATITLEAANKEIQVEGLTIGTDEACYQIVDANNQIINIRIIVNVSTIATTTCTSFIAPDTIARRVDGCQSIQVCLPLRYDSLINYTITDNGEAFSGLVSACDNGNGAIFSFSAAQNHRLIFTNNQSCSDTVLLNLHAPACDQDLVIRDTIEIMEDGRSCVSLVGLSGPFQSVKDLCPEKNGEMAMMTIDSTTGCINYTGIELGVDTACLEICNTFGFCDTVTLIVTVTDGNTPPNADLDAKNDTATTNLNDPIVLNALANDIFTTLDDMYLVNQPANGVATFNMDGTIRFVPVADFCNDSIPQTFDYAICKSGVCDTASVFVLVKCSSDRKFVIYNALSPNGDGINDVFLIEGIEDFPNNSVQIFNRWGNQVYSMKGYKNEWNGTWGKRGEKLPDGTYFYIFNDGKGKNYNGYLVIRR